MSDIALPEDEQALSAVVHEAVAAGAPLAVRGGGTRTGWGRPVAATKSVASARLTGITLYEPAELVLTARAGTPLSEVEATLAEQNQRLAFEPPDLSLFYDSEGAPTVGGVAAANSSGPRRIEAGGARDSLIGLRAVTGRGEVIKSGGRVMKNVTGYDLVKLLAGSHGTLAILSEVTFKVAPIPETEATFVIPSLDLTAAIGVMAQALGSPYALTGAAYRPAQPGERSVTALRLEGFADSVMRRIEGLRTLVSAGPDTHVLDEHASRSFWKDSRDLVPFAGGAHPVWRISVKPTNAPEVMSALAPLAPAAMMADWGGGLLWVAGGAEHDDGGTSIVRAAVAAASGGHATLVRAPEELRARVGVFQPLPPAVMELTRAIKATFDPHGLLNPGRMYADI